MSKDKGKSLGEHVKFTKHDYRPYVEWSHLVKSENFQRELKRALERRKRDIGSEQDQTEGP